MSASGSSSERFDLEAHGQASGCILKNRVEQPNYVLGRSYRITHSIGVLSRTCGLTPVSWVLSRTCGITPSLGDFYYRRPHYGCTPTAQATRSRLPNHPHSALQPPEATSGKWGPGPTAPFPHWHPPTHPGQHPPPGIPALYRLRPMDALDAHLPPWPDHLPHPPTQGGFRI